MKSFIVLGLGRFGMSVAQTLFDLGYEVLGVDADERVVSKFSQYITHVVQADITSESFLKSVDVTNFDAAIVAVGSNMQVNILATVLLKELNVKYILVKAQDDFQEKILYKIGADKVILPEKNIGIRVAHNLVSDSFFDIIAVSPDYSITSMIAPKSWQGHTLGQLAVRKKYGINVLLVRSESNIRNIPDSNTLIERESTLILMGMNEDLKKISTLK